MQIPLLFCGNTLQKCICYFNCNFDVKHLVLKCNRQSIFSTRSLRNKYEHIVSEQNQTWRGELKTESCMKASLEGWRNEITIQTRKGVVKVKERTQIALRKKLQSPPSHLSCYCYITNLVFPLQLPGHHNATRQIPPGHSPCEWPNASLSPSNKVILLYVTCLKHTEKAITEDWSSFRKRFAQS